MIRHVVLLKWNEGVDEAHKAAAKAGLDRLPGLIPQIVSYQNGPDLRAVPDTLDFALTADFGSVDDFITYRTHPAHMEVVHAYLIGYCERLTAQFSLD